MTVTRAERKGRFVYSVNGTEMRTSNKAYAYATTGTGNPYRDGQHGEPDDGYYLTLHMTRAAAVKAAAQYPGMRAVEISVAGEGWPSRPVRARR